MDEELAVIREAVGKLLATPVFAASSEDLVSRLTQVHVLVQQLSAVQVALVREADGRALAAEHGATSLTAWLADLWRVHPGSVSRLVKLAKLTDNLAPAVGEALATGGLNVDQAQVIGPAIADLPAEHRAAGEAFLLDQAAVFGPRELGRLTDRLLQVVAPDIGEAKARQALERLERKAYNGRTFGLYPVMGTCAVRVGGWLDREGAAIVQAALDPLTAPRTRNTRLSDHTNRNDTNTAETNTAETNTAETNNKATTHDPRSYGQRNADALVDICRYTLTSQTLPDNGGDRPQLVVTIPLATLRQELSQRTLPGTTFPNGTPTGDTPTHPTEQGTAELDDGGRLTAETARRLACDAAIIPAVLDSDGQVLDLGRQRRLFSGAARRALVLRDRGCAFPGCDRPPRWCDAHHIRHWADGGESNQNNAVLLCGYHHRVIHTSDWHVHINPTDGQPEFLPPPRLDLLQRPRRNQYHRRQ